MKKWFDIKARGAKNAEISIYGDIGESWLGDTVTAKDFVKDIADIDAENITVRINSYGGSVSDGIAIYNAIKRHSANITIAIDGVALSIASLIAMAGDTVEMASNALMMIHAPWSYNEGNAEDLRIAADVLDKYANAMATSYSDKTGKTIDEVMAWLGSGGDHWFTAEEANAEGLIDSITNAVAVSAKFNLNRFKHTPSQAKLFNKKSKPMQKEQKKEKQAQAKANANADDVKASVLRQEKERRTNIQAKFKPFSNLDGVAELLATCLDDSDISVSAAVDKLHNKLGENMEPTAVNFNHRVETGESESEKFAQGVTQAIMARSGKEKHDPQNEYRNFRLEDIARACLEKEGHSVKGKDRITIAKAALSMRPSSYGQTSSDFTVLLENVMHRQVLTAYNATPDTWSQFCVSGSVSDFREWQRLRVGAIGDIEAVNESGEYRYKVIPDAAKEGISAVRRGNIIGVTPEVIINDDIGYIASLTTNFGRAAKRTIENRVFVLLASNPVMKDGVALFHASHKNLATAAAIPSVVSLDAARIDMAKQMDVAGNEFLDIRPNIWLGGMAHGGDTRVLVNAQYDPDTANKLQKPNKINGIVQNVIDTPRIAGTEWYLFADPTVAPVVEVVFLDGQSEPTVAIEEAFNTGGVNYRVELPFGVGAIGYEGAYKNAGA